MNEILDLTSNGLYCSNGDFYIDPRRPVKRAVLTHAHADHARWGSQFYLCAQDGKALLQARLGQEADIETLDYGEVLSFNYVKISLHPAVTISGKGRLKEALPCFCFGPRIALLPAFGSFTGNQVIRPAPDDRIFVIAGDEVIKEVAEKN